MEKNQAKENVNSNIDLDELLVKKGKVNDHLWNIVLRQSRGIINEKIETCKLIFKNYRNLPAEADSVLKALAAPTENEDVRRLIASELVKEKIEIPSGIYLDLLVILSNDPSQEIRRTIEPQYTKFIKEPFMALLKLRETMQGYQINVALKIAKLAKDYNQAIVKSLIPFAATFSKISKIFEEQEFKTFEYNWLGFLPIDQTIEMYKMHKAGRDAEIEQALLNVTKDKKYLDDLIDEMKASAIFEPRIPIIQDAIHAHEEGKYSLSVPVFLAQIEGILWAYAEKQGVRFRDRIITKKGEKELKSATLLLTDTKIKDQLYRYITQEYLSKIYTEDFRHAILHGRDTTYGIEKNSMKLLFFLRALLGDCR